MKYWMEQFYFAFVAIAAVGCSYVVCSKIGLDSILGLVIKGGITVMLSGCILLVGLLASKRRHAVLEFMSQVLQRRNV